MYKPSVFSMGNGYKLSIGTPSIYSFNSSVCVTMLSDTSCGELAWLCSDELLSKSQFAMAVSLSLIKLHNKFSTIV